MRLTKIIATIGPACDTEEVIKGLISAGMDIARLNFSHGSHEYFARVIKRLRIVSKNIPIILDTKGPEVRTVIPEGHIKLQNKIILSGKPCSGCLQLSHDISRFVKPGDRILIDNGHVGLRVKDCKNGRVECIVTEPGEVAHNRGVIAPGRDFPLPDISEHDKKDLLFGVSHRLDFVAASFVKRAETIRKIRGIAKGLKIIAKIEHPLALRNIDELIKASDGVMIARGDLGLNIPPEEVPLVQKEIIRRCNLAAKPVIVATQMLESMVKNPVPTRAEASDVANAILDGADCLMLSGETAAGKYPIKSVEMMARICSKVDLKYAPLIRTASKASVEEHIGKAVDMLVDKLKARVVVCRTNSGFTPALISKFRPNVPIITMVNNSNLLKQVSILRGVYPFQIKPSKDFRVEGMRVALSNGWLKAGDIAIISYNSSGIERSTNSIEVLVA